MTRRCVVRGLLSVVLAVALFLSFSMPVRAETVYQKIIGPEELTTGQYVLLTSHGCAPCAVEDGWVTAVYPAVSGDMVVDTAGAEWNLTVTEEGVILTDCCGVPIAPSEDGGSEIAVGEYLWQVSWDGESVSFHGVSGENAVTLASNEILDCKFRAYEDADVADDPEGFLGEFTLYRRPDTLPLYPAPEDPEDPDDPDDPEEPQPGNETKKSPEVAILPAGGCISAGEEITLTCEDENAFLYYAVSADGVNYQPVTLYTGAICFEKGFTAAYLKAYSIVDGCEPGEQTQVLFTEEAEENEFDWNLYFGQLHAHTGVSDGVGSVEEAFNYASQVDNLDFFAVTDHSDSFHNAGLGDIGTDGAGISSDWAAGKQAALSVTDDSFVGIFGFEMTWEDGKRLGHLSTFNTPGWQTRDQEAFESVPAALENYYRALSSVPGSVSQFNHPDDRHGDFEQFSHYSPEYDSVISLLEIAGEDGVVDCKYYDLALENGWHVAPTNNQNNHAGSWGDASDARTVVLAKELTEAGLYNAMKERRVYATQDCDLAIYYELNGAVMGSIIPKSEKAAISVFLSDPTDTVIGTVEVVTDGGVVVAREWVDSPKRMLNLPVLGGYGYYYLRVTQPDGDVAVTAPVWMDGYDDMGIRSFSSDKATPVRGEKIQLTVELYNDEPVDFDVKSLSLYVDGAPAQTVSDPGTAAGMDTLKHTFSYTHPGPGVTEFRVEAVGSVNGEERTYGKTLTLSFRVPEQVKCIAVDASHGNSGIKKLNRLADIAGKNNIIVRTFKGELPENSDLLLITAPTEPFDAEFVENVRAFAESGGTVILCGQADTGELHPADALNQLLEAMGATARLDGSGCTSNAISANAFNPAGSLTKSLKSEQLYTQHAGCTVNPGNGQWLVKDVSASGEEAVLLALEELPEGGKVYVSGGLFLADEEMKEPVHIWQSVSANQAILESLLKIHRAALPLTTIGEARRGQEGQVFHIRGWATSGTSHPGNVFPETLYLQDDTGGIALIPFTNDVIEVGTPIEAAGYKQSRDGNVVLKIIEYAVLEGERYNYVPKTTLHKTAMDYGLNGGKLLQLEGKVTDVTYAVGGKGVSRFTLKDKKGDLAEVLIEDGIVSGADGVNDLASQVKEGRTVRAIGILHLDGNGTPVLRVRNCDEVVYVPPIPISLGSRRNPRTGDLIWISVGVMVLSGIALAVLIRRKKR